ncbi:MAG: tyrosine--tRNA ligase [Candidatus Saccharimonadales bacterium]
MDTKLSEDLLWRGLIKDKTFEDITYLDEPKTFYLGVDCSSPSMTIGNLALFMLARRLLDYGWNTVLLVGGATSLIGDPGGKADERDLKSREEIKANVEAIAGQVNRLFDGQKFALVDNYDWFQNVGYLEFLRDVGKHFSMTELVQRDYIATRMGEGGSGISYAEFSYSLIQGYDFWHLYKNHGVQLQIGGSDQWGNMLSGVPLIRKKENADAQAMSAPLVINKATGKKFGKSEAGAVWLDPELTTPYQFYQFWLNVDDEGVADYLKIYTLLSKDEIEALISEFEQDKASRLAQKTLAYEVTKIVHGEARAESVKRISEVLFGARAYDELTTEDFEALGNELGVFEAFAGVELAGALVDAGLASSKGEARRFLESNAIYINGSQIPLGKTTLDAEDAINGYAVLRRGKNAQVIIAIK